MDNETLQKAVKIERQISDLKANIRWIEIARTKKHWIRIATVDTSVQVTLPESIRETVIMLAMARLNAELSELETEFEQL